MIAESMEDKIKQRIEQLKTERDAFIMNANQQIAAFNGAIQVLETLLSGDAPPDADTNAQAETGDHSP